VSLYYYEPKIHSAGVSTAPITKYRKANMWINFQQSSTVTCMYENVGWVSQK